MSYPEMKRLVHLIVLTMLSFCANLPAAPYIPATDDEILERLPLASDATARELRALRKTLSVDPDRLDLAVNLAQRYIDIGKKEADPRYYGYAQGALQAWWNVAEPPSEVLMLRATILQNRHDFDTALRDLEILLRRDPHNAQAWLARAVILQVRARYDKAKLSCLKLMEFKDTMPVITCLSNVGSLTGQAEQSYTLLRDALKNAPTLSEEQRLWSLTVLAEIAVRLGRNEEAAQFFTDALKLRQNDVYLLTAYADFLLDQNKPAEAIELLADKTRIDALLLRLALAKQRLNNRDLPDDISTLKARFEASRMRGESLHQGDEARLNLFLLKQPQEALKLAQANWQAQREPRDARILLETALATGRTDAAQPVIDLLAVNRMEDLQLNKLAAQFGKN